jgi:hypothetical protein
MRAGALLALGIALAGCSEVSLSAITPPPPGRDAALDDEADEIRLSRGVALAFECVSRESGYSGPCRDATIAVDDPTVATVYRAHLDALGGGPWSQQPEGPQQQTAFVVVGLGAGQTTVRVATSAGDVDLALTVR